MTHREHINADPDPIRARECPQCRGAGEYAYPGDGLRTTRCAKCGGHGFIRVTPRFDPEQCQECGAPFNDADAPSHGLCPACYA